jgi:hypothetical protein
MKNVAQRVAGCMPLIERSAETWPRALLIALCAGLRILPLLSKTCLSPFLTPMKSGRLLGNGGDAPVFGVTAADDAPQTVEFSPATCTRNSTPIRSCANQWVKVSPSRKETPTFSVCSRLRKYWVVVSARSRYPYAIAESIWTRQGPTFRSAFLRLG